MKILSDNEKLTESSSVALGLFDGVHRGHQLVIGKAVSMKPSLKAAVFTFKTSTVTSKGANGLEMLLDEENKLKCFERLKADYVYSPDFMTLRDTDAEDFVKEILVKRLCCKYAVCGEDFRFGKKAAAGAEELKRFGEKYGFDVCVVGQVKSDSGVISSTEIRRLIKGGEIAKANDLLGYEYGYTLSVEHGNEIGRTWDFPTINQIIPQGLVLPRFGVYCAKACVDGVWHNAITNIGIKPTVEKHSPPLAETFIFDFDGNLYGKTVEIKLYEFVRPEMTFSSFDELKAEIARNIIYVKKYFGCG